MKNPIELRQALKYFKEYSWKTILLKFGWDIILSKNFDSLIKDIWLLKSLNINIVLIFGAWRQITEYLEKKWIEFEIKDWIRQTNYEASLVIDKICSQISENIVLKFRKIWFDCSYLPNIVTSKRFSSHVYNANVWHVCSKKINKAFKEWKIILIWASHKTKSWIITNVNADEVAFWIEKKIKPYKAIFLTWSDWVLDKNWKLIKILTKKEADKMIKSWFIHWWMKVKVETCFKALQYTSSVHIISWFEDWRLLEDLFWSEWYWTLIK